MGNQSLLATFPPPPHGKTSKRGSAFLRSRQHSPGEAFLFSTAFSLSDFTGNDEKCNCPSSLLSHTAVLHGAALWRKQL